MRFVYANWGARNSLSLESGELERARVWKRLVLRRRSANKFIVAHEQKLMCELILERRLLMCAEIEQTRC
jgi:hypothetical protein